MTWLDLLDQVEQVPAGFLSQEQRGTAAVTVADCVGVAWAGHRQPEMLALLSGAGHQDMAPPADTATLWQPGMRRTCASNAAYLNATAGSFLELDEGIRPTGHPAMQVVPAAVATAEAVAASGAQLLEAAALGYEVAAQLFRSYRLRYPVHPHGHFGAVGAAVASARLSGTSVLRAATIAALAPTASTWDSCFEGATARNTWMGAAAERGVRAAQLARAGFRGSRSALDTAFDGLLGDRLPEGGDLRLDLDRLAMGTGYLKRHSACALTHAALDAVLELLPRLEEPSSITAIRVATVGNNLKVARQAEPNSLSTRFSLPYAVAAAVVHGHTGPSAFQWSAEVAELAQRVEVTVDPVLEQRWPGASPARVSVRNRSGVVETMVDNPFGFTDRPFTLQDVRDKFSRNVGEHAASAWSVLSGIADAPEVGGAFRDLGRTWVAATA